MATSKASHALTGFLVVVLTTSCGTTFEETRRDPLPASPSVEVSRRTVVVPARADREMVPVSREELVVFLRTVLPALSKLHATRAVGHGFEVVPAIGESLDPGRLAMAQQYQRWCASVGRVRDCVGALQGKPYLDGLGKYRVAFDIALGANWYGFTGELKDMIDVKTLVVFLLGVMVTYMGMIALPTLVTQAIAAVFTLVITAYLGAETIWNLIIGWKQMVDEVDAATTFSQLQAAGERYGKRVGAQIARILIMAITAAVAEGGVAARLLDIPKEFQASMALAADTGGRLDLAAAGQVHGVAVAPSGVTVVLESVAGAGQAMGMAMDAKGTPGTEPQPAKKEPGEWRKARSPARGRAAKYQQQITGHSPEEGYVVNGVEFDGYKPNEGVLVHAESGDGVLLDAKGEGYEKFFEENLAPKRWFKGAKKLLEQAERQKRAANKIPIRWHVAEKRAAAAIEKLLQTEYPEIQVVYTPMQ